MRITIVLVVNLVANGMTEEILAEYPVLVAEDVEQALDHALHKRLAQRPA